jgi:class 3 adenylate cyclase
MTNTADTPLRKRRLGRQGLEAAETGFGAMGTSIAYGEPDPAGGTANVAARMTRLAPAPARLAGE